MGDEKISLLQVQPGLARKLRLFGKFEQKNSQEETEETLNTLKTGGLTVLEQFSCSL